MGSWLCLQCEDLVLLLHLATGLHCPAPALESDCGVLVTHLGSVSWVCGRGWICVCVSGIWSLCGYGFVSWVCVWGLCATLALGSDVWNLVSRVLCQSLVSSVWYSGSMVWSGSWGQFGIGAGVWGSAFGSGSAPGSRFWTQGPVFCPESVCGIWCLSSDGHWLQFNGSRSSRGGVWGRRGL